MVLELHAIILIAAGVGLLCVTAFELFNLLKARTVHNNTAPCSSPASMSVSEKVEHLQESPPSYESLFP